MSKASHPTEQDEIRMIDNPNLWPHLVLPVKRRSPKGGMPEIATVLKLSDGTFSLYHTDFMTPPTAETKLEKFATAEAVVLAGWVVD